MSPYVGSRGPTSARIFILAEAPGEVEEREGLPLVGPTGKLTEKFAQEAGFSLNECFIVNVVRERPPTYYLNGRKVSNDINLYITDKKKAAIAQGFIQHNGLWIKPVVKEWLEQLEKEIGLVRPTLLVVLGRVALWATIYRPAKITEWRGTFYTTHVACPNNNGGTDTLGILTLATLHPASVFRNPNAAAFIARDFARVGEYLDGTARAGEGSQVLLDGSTSRAGGSERKTEAKAFHFTIHPSFDQALSLLGELRTRLDSSRTPLPVAVDLETKHKLIDCIGFGLSATEAFCIPILCRDGFYWSEDEEVEIIKLIREVLSHHNIQVLGQNFSYDAQYLARQWGLVLPSRLYDTMVSWHVLFPGLEKGLDVLNSLFAEHPEQWKPENKEVSRRWTDEENWTYNCKDCIATFGAAEQLPALIEKEGLADAWTFQHRQLPVVQRMMLRGVRWNQALANELDADLSRRIDATQASIDFIAGHPLNVGSNGPTGQMQRFFYADLQVPPVFDRKTKQPTTGKEALPAIAKREPLLRPLTQLIEHRRRMSTYRSTFIRAKTDWDGRMRSSFNVAGTETFRPASHGDAFWLGTNLLNFPRGKETAFLELLQEAGPQELARLDEGQRDTVLAAAEVGFVSIANGVVSANPNFRLPNVRRLLCPDPDYTLASCDLSGADFQVVVWEAGDEALKQMLRAGMKIHRENAKVLGWNPDDPEDYDMSKRFVHLTDYAGGPRTCAISLSTMSGRHVTIEDMAKAQARWFHEHPKFKEWHEKTLQELIDTHEVRAVSGFRRYYFDPPHSILPEALAWKPQHLVAWVTNTGICNLDEQFAAENVQPLINVYDESVFQFPESNLHRLPAYLSALRIPIPYDDPLTIPIQCKLSTKSWGELAPMEEFLSDRAKAT
jgi:DNA polymerase I-like protein with 3'-5' exonuclease and polymerase domains/uracil-DNA glycosylase